MNKHYIWLVAAFAVFSCANPQDTEYVAPNTLTKAEIADGWKLLFDGKTTEGCMVELPNGKMKSREGTVVDADDLIAEMEVTAEEMCRDHGKNDDMSPEQLKELYHMLALGALKYFILKVDFQFTEGANSGIKYFVDPLLNTGPGSAIGCEFQILDDQRHPDAKLGVKGNRTLGSLYDLIPAPHGPWEQDTVDGWSTAMIVVDGPHVEHWLNGHKLLEYERQNQMWDALVAYSKYGKWPDFGNADEGYILLQDHGFLVRFRNIKIKEL